MNFDTYTDKILAATGISLNLVLAVAAALLLYIAVKKRRKILAGLNSLLLIGNALAAVLNLYTNLR